MKIGIVGQGFVGSAIREGLKSYYDVITYDLDVKKCTHSQEDICKQADIIFMCLPTPMRKDGSCDTRILEAAVTEINKICSSDPEMNRPILVIKSTVPPGTTQKLDKLASVLSVCFSPEFLTEANSFEDFKEQTRIIVGGNTKIKCSSARKVKRMFRKPFPRIPIVVTKWETAEMVKYFTNCFLASKVTFANQMFEICEIADIDYDKVCEYALYDTRIGKSHLAVPGPDGDRGFGGHCFPKDLAAMIKYAKDLDVMEPLFLEAIESFNDTVRSNRDWENMKGRAVSDD